MIRVRHDVDVLQLLKNRGYNTGVIRKRRLLGQSTLTTLRHKGRLSMGELEAVCGLLGGQPGDYIEYVPDTVGVGDVGSGEAEARAAGDGAEAEAVTVEPADTAYLHMLDSKYNLDSLVEEITENGEDYIDGLQRHIDVMFPQFAGIDGAHDRVKKAVLDVAAKLEAVRDGFR